MLRAMTRACPACLAIYASDTEFCSADGTKLVAGDPFLGRTIAQFRIDSHIGTGATGFVYRAYDLDRRSDVALKILRTGTGAHPNVSRRFEREAEIIGTISHPNVVSVVEFGIDGPLLYLAMELLEGVTLQDEIERSGKLSIERAAAIGSQIARGLEAAHRTGFVHRDLKSGNIMLIERDGEEHVKILDFGVSGILDDSVPLTRLTQEGFTVGTPAYMAPEQLNNPAVGPEADLYALGVILFEMVTGDVPFRGTVSQVLMQHLSAKVPGLDALGPMGALIGTLLDKEPRSRPKDAAAIAEKLDAFARGDDEDDTTIVLPEKPAPAPAPAKSDQRWALSIAAIAGAAFISAAVGASLLVREERKKEAEALAPIEIIETATVAAVVATSTVEHTDELPEGDLPAGVAGDPLPRVKRIRTKRPPPRALEAELLDILARKGLEPRDLDAIPETRAGLVEWRAARTSGDRERLARAAEALAREVKKATITPELVRAKIDRLERALTEASSKVPQSSLQPLWTEYLELSSAASPGLAQAQAAVLAARIQKVQQRLAALTRR